MDNNIFKCFFDMPVINSLLLALILIYYGK